MSMQFSELCKLLVQHFRGDLPHEIFHTLLHYGRSRAPVIGRRSGLSQSQVAHGLSILLNSSLVTYDERDPSGHVFYEADRSYAYNLVRLSKDAELTLSRYGQEVAETVVACQELGLATTGQIAEEVQSPYEDCADAVESQANQEQRLRDGRREGHNGGAAETVNQLISSNFLEETNDYSFMSETDLELQVGSWLQTHVKDYQQSISGPKKFARYQEALREKKTMVKRGLDSLEDPVEGLDPKNEPKAQSRSRKKRKVAFEDEMEEEQAKAGLQNGEKSTNTKKTKPSKSEQTTHHASNGEENDPVADGHEANKEGGKGMPPPAVDGHVTKVDRNSGSGAASSKISDVSKGKLKTQSISGRKRKSPETEKKEQQVDSGQSETRSKKQKTQRKSGTNETQQHESQESKEDTNSEATERKSGSSDGDQSDDGSTETGITSPTVEKVDTPTAIPANDGAHDQQAEGLSTTGPEAEQFFRLNRKRFTLGHRSTILSDFATRKLGNTAGNTYSALLQALEDVRQHVESLAESAEDGDENQIVASTEEVIQKLDPATTKELKKEAAIRESFENEGHADKEHDRGNTNDDEPEHEEHDRDDKKPAERPTKGAPKKDVANQVSLSKAVNDQLWILAEDPEGFVDYDNKFKTWSVDHESIIYNLVQVELERTITARFGPLATRMVRILHEQGKLEEKQIGVHGFIPQRELRVGLASLQAAGYVEVQEIPRDSSRQATNSLYLWSYDQEHCRQLVLEYVYKTMSRLLQHFNYEKEGVKGVLEKSQRTDVRGNEDRYLSQWEKDALQRWREKEEKLYLHLARLDELVMLFGDFSEHNGD